MKRLRLLKDLPWLERKAGDIISAKDVSEQVLQVLLASGEAMIVERTAILPQSRRKAVTK